MSTNIDNVWTYDLDEVWKGIQGSYQKMAEQVTKMYGVSLKATGAIGISAMMHGYLAFDSSGRLLTPFRTWRNNFTGRVQNNSLPCSITLYRSAGASPISYMRSLMEKNM